MANPREDVQRVYLFHEFSQAVGHVIGKLHPQSVLIDQGGVFQPIGDSVLLLGRLYDESVVRLEIESLTWGISPP